MSLNVSQIKSLKPGDYADGSGLYLVVRETGERRWAFRFTDPQGKRAKMEFAHAVEKPTGRPEEMSLAEARDAASHYRLDLKRNGIDPRVRKRINTTSGMTFGEFALAHYKTFCIGRAETAEADWLRSINDVPSLHPLKIADITTEDVLAALKPIWGIKPISADRARQRLERLFSAAKTMHLRVGENPAAWRDNLKNLLPPVRGKFGIHVKKHHPTIHYDRAPDLMAKLRFDPGRVARCVEVGILCISRSKETRLMEWREIDMEKKTWLIPAEKMKIKKDAGGNPKPHLVPLSDQALAIIKAMPTKNGKYVFPSDDPNAEHDTPFFANALTNAIRRTGSTASMHGMRSTFRNWGGDHKEHNFRREVLEHCMAHRVGDEAEQSYWTSDMIERRREALQAWADYIKPKSTTPSLRLVG
jgi:integrase